MTQMFSMMLPVLGLAALAAAQSIPNTYPHNYTGIPRGGYSPEWQKYFEVTKPLPGVTEKLPRNFAGNIAVDRPYHPNDTLFFWAWEKEEGSLTDLPDKGCDVPWLIWLNGGPGSSSMIGLMAENGHLRVENDNSIKINGRSWDRLVDAIWIDQPVGTGYSTADDTGYIADEDQMGEDFLGFLSNLVKVFPSLKSRPLYLAGESYAGYYIPYITKSIFSSPNPPVRLQGIAMGDATLADFATFEQVPTVEIIETYPQLINFDNDVYKYFKEQEHLCRYDINLTYPQQGLIPTPINPFTTVSSQAAQIFLANNRARLGKSLGGIIADSFATTTGFTKRDLEEREDKRTEWKRDLTGRPKGTLDPWYGCFLLEELWDYAVNFSAPWKGHDSKGIDVYFIPDALEPEAPFLPTGFLNDPRTREALHAPTSKDWAASFPHNYPFGSTRTPTPGANQFNDPSPVSMTFMTELAANASARGVSIAFYSGNDDSLVAHKGTQVTIQNMTFGGIQGFTRKPQTGWYDDEGKPAGIIHQERGITYALFFNAGHLVPQQQPDAAWTFLREFILGSNPTGRVVVEGGATTVIGGETPALAGDIIPGTNAIFYGSGTTESSIVAPSPTWASWFNMLQTATLTATPDAGPMTPPTGGSSSLPTATAH